MLDFNDFKDEDASLWNYAVETTKKSSNLNDKQKKINREYFTLTELSNSLANEITKNAHWEIKKAANNGDTSCDVYRYGENAFYKSKPVIFLFNGPVNEGRKYFKDLGIKDTLTILRERFYPFQIKHEVKKSYSIIKISWKHGI